MAQRIRHEQLSLLDEQEAGPREQTRPRRRTHHPDLRGVTADDLPPGIRPVYQLIGLPATLDLVRAYGGARVTIPQRPRGRLLELLGEERAAALGRVFAGNLMYVPSLATVRRRVRNRRICAAYDEGATVSDLALAEGLSHRQVESILNSPERP